MGLESMTYRATMDQPVLTTTILLQVQTNFHIWKLIQSMLQGFCKLLYRPFQGEAKVYAVLSLLFYYHSLHETLLCKHEALDLTLLCKHCCMFIQWLSYWLVVIVT